MLRSVWDFHGVGQRTGHQRLAVKEGFTAEASKPTLYLVGIPQSGVFGDEDVHLKQKKRRRDEWMRSRWRGGITNMEWGRLLALSRAATRGRRSGLRPPSISLFHIQLCSVLISQRSPYMN